MFLSIVGDAVTTGNFSIAGLIKSICDWFVLAFEYIFSFFADIVYLVKITGVFLAKIPSYFSWLPDQLVALLFTAFSIVVLYKILGREG